MPSDYQDNPKKRQIPGHMRKPVFAMMGEFSAGKSTLTNLLIGARALPVQVTATQLPPIWIAYGEQAPWREDINGKRHPVDLKKLEDIDLDETRCIRIFRKADILTCCDLIDMPGISDPNMSPEVWERLLPETDAVLWCTHATQAWRQSEAAVWEMVQETIQARSMLLLTRWDKVTSEDDRARILRRVGRETEGLFGDTFPISLTDALAAGDDRTAWVESGAEAFVQGLIARLQNVGEQMGSRRDRRSRLLSEEENQDAVTDAFRAHEVAKAEEAQASLGVAPRRVRAVRPVDSGDAPKRPTVRRNLRLA